MRVEMLCVLVAASMLVSVQSGAVRSQLPNLNTDQVLLWVAERLEALETTSPGLSLLETQVAAMELRLSRLETKFDLQMDRLEEVLISRNNQHLEHNQAMRRKLETTSSQAVRSISGRLNTIEERISSTASRATHQLTTQLQQMQESIVCNVSQAMDQLAARLEGGRQDDLNSRAPPATSAVNTTADHSASVTNRSNPQTSATRAVAAESDVDPDSPRQLQKQVMERVEAAEMLLRSQLQRTEKRLLLDVAAINDRVQICQNHTEERLNSTQRQLQALQVNISTELKAVRDMVEQDEAEHAATRHAVYDGHSATLEAVRRGCSSDGTAPADRRAHGSTSAATGGATGALQPGRTSPQTPQPAAVSPAVQLEQQLEQLSSQLEKGLRWLDDRARKAHDEQNVNLALLASSVRNRLLEVREHLEISIITVLMAAHHNATEAARATWQHRRRTIRNLEQIVDILERLMNAIDGGCLPDRDTDYDDLLRRTDLEDLAEVTNDGFGKLQIQVAELTEELRELSTEAEEGLGG